MTLKILAVDDNPVNVTLVADIVEASGWEVIPAFDGPSAIKIAQTESPDLIVLDVSMPGMSGHEVCQVLKANPITANIPIIMLTALSDVEDRVRGLTAGADDYLTKPFSARELRARIDTRLRAKHEADNLRTMQQTIRATFERFVPPSVVNQLLEDPTRIQLGGQLQEITVIFADLENFTSISELTRADNLLTLLNGYHELVVRFVMGFGGTIDKFMGDAVMALYNTPLTQADHILRAVRTALAIQDALPQFHAQLEPQFRMNINIGIHTGVAIVGNVGAPEIMEFTAVGDTVNVAARLQQNGTGGRVLVSEAVYQNVAGWMADAGEPLHAEPMGALRLRGRAEPVVAYALRRAR